MGQSPYAVVMFEERFYRWLGYTFTAAAAVFMIFTDLSGYGFAILGVVCTVIARVIRLEQRFTKVLAASQKALDELKKFGERVTADD